MTDRQDEDAMMKYFDLEEEVFFRIWREWLEAMKRPAAKRGRQKWDLISKSKLNKVWKSFAKYGSVRDESDLDDIAFDVVTNVAKISINTTLLGHEQVNPESYVQDMLERDSQEVPADLEKVLEEFGDFAVDEKGAWRLSDYGMKKMREGAVEVLGAETPEEKIVAVDKILNVVHQRSDLASWFIEGGSNSLSELSETPMKTNNPPKSDAATLEDVIENIQEHEGTGDKEWTARLIEEASAFSRWCLGRVKTKDLNNYCENRETCEEYAEMGMENAPPIVIVPSEDGPNKYDILDGAHRAWAAEIAGLKTVLAYYPIDKESNPMKDRTESNPDAKAEFFTLLGGKQKRSQSKYYQNLTHLMVRVTLPDGGIVTFTDSEKAPDRLHFERVEVPKKLRGRGLAKMALASVAEAADLSGITLTVVVSPDEEDGELGDEDRDRGRDRLIRLNKLFGFETDYDYVGYLREQTREQIMDREARGFFPTEMIRFPKGVSKNPPDDIRYEVLQMLEAMQDAEKRKNLDARNGLATALFNQKGLRNFKTEEGRVNTWWDRQSRNWITQWFDLKDNEVDSDYSGDRLGAALSHAWALSKMMGIKL